MKLRIAITRRDCVTYLDGINRFIFNLSDGLAVLGHEVIIISYAHEPQFSGSTSLKTKFDFESNLPIYSLADFSKAKNRPKIGLTWALNGSELLRRLDVDAVIMNGIVPLRINSARFIVNHGLRHTTAFGATRFIERLYSNIGRHLYKRYADYHVCVSERLRREFKEFMGIDSICIHLPLKLRLFRHPSEVKRENLVVHIGTRPVKNVEVSIKAIQLLEKLGVNARLIVVGPRERYAENLAEKYRYLIPKRLSFLFGADTCTLRNLLSHAKVLLLPSKYETFSYSVLEAFASGLPVVVSEAIPEEVVCDGYAGFRVQGFNPAQYALRLQILLGDDSVWGRMSRNALKYAANFSHVEIAKKYEKIIASALQN